MKCKDSQAAAAALTSLGHVYTSIGDYQNALASHKQCVDLVRTQLDDKLQEAREIGNVGAVYLAIGDFDKAVECHMDHLSLAESLDNKVEAARAYRFVLRFYCPFSSQIYMHLFSFHDSIM